MFNKKLSELELLEKYRISLKNVENQTLISQKMQEFGYDTKEIEKGKKILKAARNSFDSKKKESNDVSKSYNEYKKIKLKLKELYNLHRRKCKIIFRKDANILKTLGFNKALSQNYLLWLETVKVFYNEMLKETTLQQKVAKLKITKTELEQGKTLIEQIEQAKANYSKEKGESQQATKSKNNALALIEDYMIDFYAVAKIALEKEPQLLESLNIKVKS